MVILNQIRAFIAILVLLLGAPASCSAQTRLEYQVKAGFLFNFLKFVDWSDDKPNTPLVIGVLGRDPFGGYLEEAVKDKKINGRDVVVRHFVRASEVGKCSVLFVPDTDFRRSGVPVVRGVLTVGESTGFLDAGGVIGFYLDNERVRFEISADAARGAGLRVSAQLLKLGSAR